MLLSRALKMFILLTLCFLLETTVRANVPKLLVVSYDGFRYDYFNRNLNPYMSRLRGEGVHSDYMVNIFTTKTYPNHHTIATGYYAENHGVIDNGYYDVNSKKNVVNSSGIYDYDKTIVPIWTLNQMQGRNSGSMMWPGSIYEYLATNLTFVQDFDPNMNWTNRVDTVISWFKHEKTPINFGLLYIEEPDKHGHGLGIYDPRFNDILKKLDAMTEYLHKKLMDNGLEDVNVIHLSDHGMASVPYKNIINVTQFLDPKDCSFFGTGPGLNIYPKEGKKDEIYKKLKSFAEENKHIDVWLKEDIPKKYHYNKNTRIGPIFITAKINYTVDPLYDSIQYYKKEYNLTINNNSEFGIHGYDNGAKEMRPFFFANGPAFLSKCKLKPFNNVDLYPLFCDILQLDCPPTNGTLQEIRNCLAAYAPVQKEISYKIVLIVVGISMIVAMMGALFYRYLQNRKTRSSYRRSSIL